MNGNATVSVQPRFGRVVKGLFALTMVVVTIGWVLHFPCDEQMLYRVVSPDAVWVSEHDRLSDRWNDMARNPVLLGVLSGMDVPPSDVQEFMTKGPWRGITRLMTGQRAVVSYEDGSGIGGRPAWVIASWVGGAVQLVRWDIVPKLIPGMKSVNNLGLQRKAWIMPIDSKKARLRRKLVITTQDGMLIGVISENPMAIRDVLARLNRDPRVFDLGWHPGQAFDDQPYSDRAWLMDAKINETKKLPEMTIGCTTDGGSGVSGEIRLPTIPVMPGDVIDPAAATGLRRLLATKPDTFICGTSSFLEGLGVIPATSENWAALEDAVRVVAPKAKAMCAALMSDEFSGRIHGIKIRSLVLGFPVGDGVGVDDVLGPLMNYVNGQHPWGVEAHAGESAGIQIRALDCSQEKLVAGLERSDKPACVVVDGWFFIVSNLTALEAFLKVPVPGEDPALAARLSTSLYARSNLETTYAAIQNVLSVYLLSQMFEESAETKNGQIRTVYDAMNQWSTVATILKQAELWVEVPEKGGSLKIAMRIGPQKDLPVMPRFAP